MPPRFGKPADDMAWLRTALCGALVLFLCYVGFSAGVWRLRSYQICSNRSKGPVGQGMGFTRLPLVDGCFQFPKLTFWTIETPHTLVSVVYPAYRARHPHSIFPLATTNHSSRPHRDVEKLNPWQVDLTCISLLGSPGTGWSRLGLLPVGSYLAAAPGARRMQCDHCTWPSLLIYPFVCNFLLGVGAGASISSETLHAGPEHDAEATLNQVHRLPAIAVF